MSFVIMAVQEEGSETRISDFDKHDRGFNTQKEAYEAYNRICNDDRYPEYRQIWVEELKDSSYWYERSAQEGFTDSFDVEFDGFNDGQEW